VVPAAATGSVIRCTQNVSPSVAKYWPTSVWPGPRVRAVWPSQSLPTPITIDLSLVVTSVADGAPTSALVLAIAPMAPDPFVPDGSTPLKLITVIIPATPCESVPVTLAPVNGVGANARQISASPRWAFVRPTSVQVSPPPLTAVTEVGGVCVTLSSEKNASSSSFGAVVLK